jgi:hypothetical protein
MLKLQLRLLFETLRGTPPPRTKQVSNTRRRINAKSKIKSVQHELSHMTLKKKALNRLL